LPAQRAKNRGFTLIEVIVVVGIAAILMLVAVPSYTATIVRNRLASETNELVTALQFARSEAIKEGSAVSVCASRNQVTCNTTTSNSWHEGFIVFSDPNNNGAIDAGDVILRNWPAYKGGETAVASNGLSVFTFNRQGFAAGLPANPVTLAVSADANTSASNNQCIVISLAGRIQTKAPIAGVCS
jgi:type IV fimbrial biogenesis protein FimT